MNSLMFIGVVAGLIAVLYALLLAARVKKADPGTDRMQNCHV